MTQKQKELQTIYRMVGRHKFYRMKSILLKEGYKQKDIENIIYDNLDFSRLFKVFRDMGISAKEFEKSLKELYKINFKELFK